MTVEIDSPEIMNWLDFSNSKNPIDYYVSFGSSFGSICGKKCADYIDFYLTDNLNVSSRNASGFISLYFDQKRGEIEYESDFKLKLY